jgi:hypothetical protein
VTPSYEDPTGRVEFPLKVRWVQYLLEHYGVPTLLLLVGLWWFASRVAEPLVQSHVQFLEQQTKISKEMAETQKTQTETLQGLRDWSLRSDTSHQQQLQALDKIDGKLKPGG